MTMQPHEFKAWRKLLTLTQAEAATKLGISTRTVEVYESGKRSDSTKEAAIPRAIELACAALAAGIENYAGPERQSIRWRVNVANLLADGDLPEGVMQWWLNNLKCPIIVQNGFAAFDTEKEAASFKITWISG